MFFGRIVSWPNIGDYIYLIVCGAIDFHPKKFPGMKIANTDTEVQVIDQKNEQLK